MPMSSVKLLIPSHLKPLFPLMLSCMLEIHQLSLCYYSCKSILVAWDAEIWEIGVLLKLKIPLTNANLSVVIERAIIAPQLTFLNEQF